ncbi:putative mfs multidrug transporter protein [Neofusicoccum parvum UCRNP2]|uniref:Putative mfs multidrug transporter protein n=1 Tax=Botryosphaeria parva (strain UCR-NP2) TaxID=1287680 RepID=R1E7D8_BOTPV|nr:putative mfs multidrug transporter protein [Neofusicoccum parvum UCRNP2]
MTVDQHEPTPTETSPLLRRPSSSSLSTKSAQTAVSDAPDVEDTRISVVRGTVIIASLGLIMFLQACNFSLLTTTQSAIAADLDAFEQVSWFTSAYLRAVFWLQTPLGVLAAITIVLSLPSHLGVGKGDTRTLKQKLYQIDYAGAITLTASITTLLIALSGPKILFLPLILSIILFPIFLITELRFARDPIIPITLLKSRGTLFTCLATLGFMMSRWSVLFYTPVYALGVRLWSPAAAGSILIPTNLGFGSGGLLAGFLHIRRAGSFYLPTLIAMSLFPVTLLALGLASRAATPAPLYVVLTFLNGLTTGAAINYALVHALHLTPPATHFVLTSLVATFRGFAGSFGSAIGGGVFARLLADSLARGFRARDQPGKEELIRRLLGSPALVAQLDGVDRAVAISGYEDALRGLFLAAVVLGVVALAVQAGTGWRGYQDEDGQERRHEDESAEEREREREEEEIAETRAA